MSWGGGLSLAKSATAGPTPQGNTNPLLRSIDYTSETVNGFTLNPTKGPANQDNLATITPPKAPPATNAKFVKISAGTSHVLALTDDGETYGWGANYTGEVGDGTTVTRYEPIHITNPAGVHFTQISAGGGSSGGNSMAIGSDGNVYAWGDNSEGQIGDGTKTNRLVPTKISLGTSARPVQVCAGFYYSMVLTSDNAIYMWGANFRGRLANGSATAGSTTPVRILPGAIPSGTQITSISAGTDHAMALSSTGTAYAWGRNDMGQVGDGTTVDKLTPVKVLPGEMTPGSTIIAISAGGWHSLAIGSDHTVYGWGSNTFYSLGTGNRANKSTPTKVLRAAMVPNTYITAISAGRYHSVAIGNDNTVYGWGLNDNGQLGDGTRYDRMSPVKTSNTTLTAGTHFTAISASLGGDQTAGLASDNTVYGWGKCVLFDGGPHLSPYQAIPPIIRWQYTITAVSFGSSPVNQKTENTNTRAWNLQVPQHPVGLVDVAVSYSIDGIDTSNKVFPNVQTGSLTLHYEYKTTQTVQFDLAGAPGTAPDNQYPMTGGLIDSPDPTPTWAGHEFKGWFTASGDRWDFNTPVSSNMTLTAKWRPNQFKLNPNKGPVSGGNTVRITPPEPPEGVKYTQISGGGQLSLAIGNDGNTYAWGTNIYGQLGDGVTPVGISSYSTTPVRVRAPKGIHFIEVGAGHDSAIALATDGNVYTWGDGVHGQLANGEGYLQSNVPIKASIGAITRGTYITTISAGGNFILALSNDGGLYAWGQNLYGQLGDDSLTNKYVPVKVKEGAIAAGTYITAIIAGYQHSIALGSNHALYSWGLNNYGQLGDGSNTNKSTPVKILPGEITPGTYITTLNTGNGDFNLAIANDHTVYAWGNNYSGQLGDGSNTNKNTPVKILPGEITPGTYITTLKTGPGYTMALTDDHAVYMWGDNWRGVLGNGTTLGRNTPGKIISGDIPSGTDITAISAGYAHALALGNDSTIYAWGDNGAGELGTGNTASRSTPVRVGKKHEITVTGIKFDQTEAAPAPVWDAGSSTWNVSAPAHSSGQVTANIHWTLDGTAQSDYPLPYTYNDFLTLPKAGAIPLHRLTGGTLLGLTTLSALTYAGYQLSHRRQHPGKHATISA
ncbi:hypothetical protein KIM372_06910 [Bombiscardovia nodaiensis]|uniref:RCC1-like domain-containing protein n=1 Tax=Bombiscardovia nodaiensis TaxID=2932181 RepID=A0ABM8B7R2_9BIFI|nr:hypothetical protein KIM372_06910 [Bombiscardovia nodaiensis]